MATAMPVMQIKIISMPMRGDLSALMACVSILTTLLALPPLVTLMLICQDLDSRREFFTLYRNLDDPAGNRFREQFAIIRLLIADTSPCGDAHKHIRHNQINPGLSN